MTPAIHIRNGASAASLIRALVNAHSTIDYVETIAPPFGVAAQDRAPLTPDERNIVQEALALRSGEGLPFWDAVLARASRARVVPEHVLEAALFHNEGLPIRRRWDRAQVLVGDLEAAASIPCSEHMLAACSAVQIAGGATMHIPMLDFHCACSEEALALVHAVIRRLEVPGTILESGASYHFYGHVLMSDRERIAHLGRALLLSPIIDRAWIAHQLIEGASALRISGSPKCSGRPPVVLAPAI